MKYKEHDVYWLLTLDSIYFLVILNIDFENVCYRIINLKLNDCKNCFYFSPSCVDKTFFEKEVLTMYQIYNIEKSIEQNLSDYIIHRYYEKEY